LPVGEIKLNTHTDNTDRNILEQNADRTAPVSFCIVMAILHPRLCVNVTCHIVRL